MTIENKINFSKVQALNNIKLLSALESWALSASTKLPDYLWDQLHDNLEIMQSIVLGGHDAEQKSNQG